MEYLKVTETKMSDILDVFRERRIEVDLVEAGRLSDFDDSDEEK